MANKPQKRSSRKVGRSARKPAHQRYVAEQRWLKNKAKRIARFMRKHPNYHL